MANQKFTERRRLARETRNALSLYIDFLNPSIRKDYGEPEGMILRKMCLQDAQQALDELRELEAEVEGYDYSST